ncbi:hypothetical protein HHI36_005889 [Cryptolaemus montrouzieri]|uniref:Uncharacterized protein n=1 Tax=Cryptolaemus montrouzieri TaxID=559131 RepID=A0ABD2NWG5_9CUCU
MCSTQAKKKVDLSCEGGCWKKWLKEEAKSNREASGVQRIDVGEKIIGEMLERKRRETNIIVANIEDSKAGSAVERKTENTEFVTATLAKLNLNSDNTQELRIGKYKQASNRLLKVILGSRDEVVNVLKNKKNLAPGINVFPDQTEKQRKFFKDIKSKLGEMQAEGGFSKTIRFINGTPTIVDKIRQQQQKNQ